LEPAFGFASVKSRSQTGAPASWFRDLQRAATVPKKSIYLLALARADCEQTELEMVLEERSKGPFSPLETDWKERVRKAAKGRD